MPSVEEDRVNAETTKASRRLRSKHQTKRTALLSVQTMAITKVRLQLHETISIQSHQDASHNTFTFAAKMNRLPQKTRCEITQY